MSSSLGPTSPEPRLPQPSVLSLNVTVLLLSSMHLTASGSPLLLPQLKLVCHLGWSKFWDAGQETPSPSTSKLHLLSFRRWRDSGHITSIRTGGCTCYQDLIVPVIFHNHSVMLEAFGILFWVHTCHFHLHVGGGVAPLPHLSFHSLPGGACASLVGSSVTLQGMPLLPSLHYSLLQGCASNCHPHCITHYY